MEYFKTGVTEGVPDVDVDGLLAGTVDNAIDIDKFKSIFSLFKLPKMEYVKTGVTEGVPDVDVDGVKTGVIETYGVF